MEINVNYDYLLYAERPTVFDMNFKEIKIDPIVFRNAEMPDVKNYNHPSRTPIGFNCTSSY